MNPGFTSADLAAALRDAVRQALAQAPAFDPPPNLDLAVVALPQHAAPRFANVLFSSAWPQGLIADIGADAGPVRNVHYLADAREGPTGESFAWAPGADWRRMAPERFAALAGHGPNRFIAPYPASLWKLMVAVAVGHAVDRGLTQWDQPLPFGDGLAAPPAPPAFPAAPAPTVADWAEAMIETSDNTATSALVALLHRTGLIVRRGWRAGERDSGQELSNAAQALLANQGLDTLRLNNTKPDGGWFNSSGAGVGQLQMTAWDTVRLLWRLSEPAPAGGASADAGATDPDAIAPPAPWLPPGQPALLSAASRRRLWQWLEGQALHEVLSSTLVAGEPGWQAGIPAWLPARWLSPDGGALVAGRRYRGDLRPAQAEAAVAFAHKTGTTASYVADAGRVIAFAPGGRRYLIALQATLGSRHAPSPALATDWCIPRIGAAVDRWLQQHWPRG